MVLFFSCLLVFVRQLVQNKLKPSIHQAIKPPKQQPASSEKYVYNVQFSVDVWICLCFLNVWRGFNDKRFVCEWTKFEKLLKLEFWLISQKMLKKCKTDHWSVDFLYFLCCSMLFQTVFQQKWQSAFAVHAKMGAWGTQREISEIQEWMLWV